MLNSSFNLKLCRRRIKISSALDLDITAERQLGNSNASAALHMLVCKLQLFHLVCLSVNTYRLGLSGDKLVISLVHGSKVVHGGKEDVHLDNVLEVAASRFEDGREVFEDLSLYVVKRVI